MALFPAYSIISDETANVKESVCTVGEDELAETQLLASDSEEETTAKQFSKCISDDIQSDDFYQDCKLDPGNLRMSTLYYPGRPQYDCQNVSKAVGERGGTRESRKRRYYAKRTPDEPDGPALAQRADAYRLLIAQSPDDVLLWEKFIDFQELCAGGATGAEGEAAEAALRVAQEATARVPHSARLRARLLVALRRTLSLHEYLERLRDMLSKEPSADIRLELWERLLRALPAAPGVDAAQLTSATSAALADTRQVPHAYSRLLYVHGSYLAEAGLWERLVLMIELVIGMNYAPAVLPPPDAALVRRAEATLTDTEDKTIESGLPLSAVWVRVERARASVHWRAAALSAQTLDPQRTPLPHDVADLLQPVISDTDLFQLSVRLLLLAKVPLLPGVGWVQTAGCGTSMLSASGAEALLPLLCAAATLPPVHPARLSADPELARRALVLLLDPPHYFTDDFGYLSWVNGLWDVCCEKARGSGRVALVCWRLRWLRALLAMTTHDVLSRKETARIRADAKSLLRRFNVEPESPLPFAEFAYIERQATGRERALHVGWQALRAAVLDATCPPHHALYVARILCEVSSSGSAQLSAEGACALVCAVLQRAPPVQVVPPAPQDILDALQRCEQQCDSVENSLASSSSESHALEAEALLPGAGEWARARALLAPPPRRHDLIRALLARSPSSVAGEQHELSRYYEESAETLCAAAAREGRGAVTATALATIFPDNAYCALARGVSGAWTQGLRETPGIEERLRALCPRHGVSALAAILPLLLQAVRTDFQPKEAQVLTRMSRRMSRGGPEVPALLWTLRLEAEARAPAPRLTTALYAALDAAPQHKWLYVRGAAWCGSEAGALADALLERALRLHALPDELRAPDAD